MSGTKRFWWVRHAPTHAKSMIGWTDHPADTSNTGAFERLSAALPQNAPIITSTLSRTIKTADAFAQGRTRLTPIDDLREIHFGDWENLTFEQADKRDPVLLREFWDSPGDTQAPNGESWNALCKRVNLATDGLLTHPESDLILVAHFGTILTQVQRARKVDTVTVFGQKIDNLSITCLEYSGDWRAEMVNFNAADLI